MVESSSSSSVEGNSEDEDIGEFVHFYLSLFILRSIPEPTRHSYSACGILKEGFRLFITPEMARTICSYTNDEEIGSCEMETTLGAPHRRSVLYIVVGLL